MLTRTFQHLPGVGPYREKDLWAQGVESWDAFPAEGAPIVLSARQDPLAREVLSRSRTLLEARDLPGLAKLIPPREHWRLYPEFSQDAAFFDVECDGRDSMAPTVVSVFDRDGLHPFIAGRNLEQLPGHLAKRRLWVSFNGSVFDVPVLRSYFGERFPTPDAHIDLRFVCRKARWKGGLKKLEDSLGIARPVHLKGVTGWDAVDLWRRYRSTGDIASLRLLVEYNLYDTFQLRSVMERAYNRIAEVLGCEVPKLTPFDRGEILYDVSRLLLSLQPTREDVARQLRRGPQDRDLRQL